MEPYKTKENWHKRAYISGKMKGLERLQIKGGFHRAHNELVTKYGFHPDNIISPADLDAKFPSFREEEFLKLDLFLIKEMGVEVIYMMNNWEDSEGAKKEKALAEELGLEIWYQPKKDEAELRWKK